MSDWLAGRMALPPLGWVGWFRVLWRGGVLAVVVYGCLALMLLLRLVERPLWGERRPVTPWITVFVCRVAVRMLGLRLRVHGTPLVGQGAMVANHAGWIDIFVLNAVGPLYFVAKTEVSGWAGIGVLAKATGTVFVTRKAVEAKAQAGVFEERLQAGHRLLFFPEGTSSDAQRVLPFKPTLFAAFFSPGLRKVMQVQSVSVRYRAPGAMDARFYGWWADMEFAPHLLQVLAHPGGAVDVVFHAPLRVAEFVDRKALSAACEAEVRAGFSKG
ncbi:MAG: lysophospholipid acyltransferase family protein [Paracoccaceae bacterium]